MSRSRQAETRPQLAIDVDPPLLGSTLARLLRGDDVSVVLLDDEVLNGSIADQYDVVVTSRANPTVRGTLVLRLGPAPGGPEPVAATSSHDGVVDIDQLSAVLDRIDRWRADRVGAALPGHGA